MTSIKDLILWYFDTKTKSFLAQTTHFGSISPGFHPAELLFRLWMKDLWSKWGEGVSSNENVMTVFGGVNDPDKILMTEQILDGV